MTPPTIPVSLGVLVPWRPYNPHLYSYIRVVAAKVLVIFQKEDLTEKEKKLYNSVW
ncbi:MAG: hypothetical protein IPN95_10660 [Bacteroidetes bacterium]|nr:hypothetical protein [Bacteroidota bacterium]MBL0020377.1 hypothetical protein [Bacteroidota bacterium]